MAESEPQSAETDLDLSGTDPARPVAPPSEPGAVPADGAPRPAAPGPLGDLVVAHFRRVEVAMLGRVLVTTLAGALPAAVVRVERRRSLRRLVRRPGEVVGVSVTVGTTRLGFRAPEVGVVEATIGHVVEGIVLQTERVSAERWLDALGEALSRLVSDDESARVALERALTR